MSLGELVASMSSRGGDRLGYTSTVKDQIDNIECNIENFKHTLESQRKQQGQIQFNIKKLEQQSKTNLHELHKEISERVNYLTQLFRSDSRNQQKQFEYLELQNAKLHEEHEKLNELSTVVAGRTSEAENNVGL